MGDGRIKVSVCVHSLCSSSVIEIIVGGDCTHVHYIVVARLFLNLTWY